MRRPSQNKIAAGRIESGCCPICLDRHKVFSETAFGEPIYRSAVFFQELSAFRVVDDCWDAA